MRIQSIECPVRAWNAAEPPVNEAVRKADPKNILRSGQIHPELAKRTERLIETAVERGLSLYVFQGYRNAAGQARAYAEGRSKAKPGNSFHNYGLAVDIVFKDAKGQPSWSESHDWQTLGRIGKEEGLHWGGDWTSFNDRPHFQLVPNEELATVKRLHQKGGLEAVWGSFN